MPSDINVTASLILKSLMIVACANLAMPASAAALKSARSHHAMIGQASYYTDPQPTASGERFDPRRFTAAHRTLPFGTRVVVTNLQTNRHVIVRINDRGPYIRGRIVDLSYAAAREIGMTQAGTAAVRITFADETIRKQAASSSNHVPGSLDLPFSGCRSAAIVSPAPVLESVLCSVASIGIE